MTEMTFAQARSVALQVKNHYKAFAKLDEVLEAASKAQSAIPNLKGQITKLKKEVEAILEDRSNVEASVDEINKAVKEAQQHYSKLKADKVREVESAAREKRKEFEAERDAAIAGFENQRTDMEATLSALKADIRAAQIELKKTEDAIERLKRRFAA